jgi:hypothetical protein
MIGYAPIVALPKMNSKKCDGNWRILPYARTRRISPTRMERSIMKKIVEAVTAEEDDSLWE